MTFPTILLDNQNVFCTHQEEKMKKSMVALATIVLPFALAKGNSFEDKVIRLMNKGVIESNDGLTLNVNTSKMDNDAEKMIELLLKNDKLDATEEGFILKDDFLNELRLSPAFEDELNTNGSIHQCGMG
jgi:hypothetical protein